jgi:hypothetical protein
VKSLFLELHHDSLTQSGPRIIREVFGLVVLVQEVVVDVVAMGLHGTQVRFH